MEKMKRVLCLLLCAVMLLVNVPSVVIAAETDELSEQIAQLPKVSDPLGTEFYFYNQLSDFEKVMYWKMSEATWDDPVLTISGVTAYTENQLQSMCQRALTALVADDPEYHMYWERYAQGSLSGDTYSFALRKYEIASEYLIRKANARINQIVETVGTEGDIYSRTRDLLELLHQEMDYDSYYPFSCNQKVWINDSAFGCLIYGTAVCAGFSDTVKILCDKLNIPCIIVGNAGHAWNFVKMDDRNWYAVDASRDVSFDWECNIVGSESGQYASEPSYTLSDLYLAEKGDFSFPVLNKDAYVYQGAYSASYHNVKLNFKEPSPTFTYKVNDDGTTCTIIGYEGAQTGDLIIPNKIDGYTVTAIGDAAFYRSTGFTGNLIIPDTVKEIGSCAFLACTGLTGNLVLPNNLQSIGEHAFLGNKTLSGKLNFPSSLSSIGCCAFYDCENLTGDIILPDGISLGDEIFYNCSGLTGTLYLPDDIIWGGNIVCWSGVSKIHVNATNPNYATYDGMLFSKDMKTLLSCPSGKTGDLVIPEGVETIARIACYGCNKLDGTLTLPKTLKLIDDFAFQDATLIGDLVIPDTVEKIGVWAFSGCKFNGKLVLPKALTRIEEGSFFACPFTGDLYIPDNVKYIGSCSFFATNFSGKIHMSEAIEYIGGNGITGIFSNALELKDRNVTLEKDAFFATYFGKFSCDCNSDYETQLHVDNKILIRCTHCGGGYTVSIQEGTESVQRIFGATRYDTAIAIAEQLKKNLGVSKFNAIVVASGTDFADALPGAYLANQKGAPVLLVRNRNQELTLVKNYIKENLAPGGTVYILGGEKAVPKAMETGLEGFAVKRLGGATRYETNLLILKEGGVKVGDDILVCTGKDFPDSLAASAVNKPILLVKDSLNASQTAFLNSVKGGKLYIIGGTAAVNARIENALKTYGTTQRLSGATRYYTSVEIAKTFFPNTTKAVLAYGENFPDGMCGGTLAYSMGAPVLLTTNSKSAASVAYTTGNGIHSGAVLGGTTLISDKIVEKSFGG